jgi:hypothetical protein
MISLIRTAVERGVTFFDTAEAYGPYANEELQYAVGTEPFMELFRSRSRSEGGAQAAAASAPHTFAAPLWFTRGTSGDPPFMSLRGFRLSEPRNA